MATEKIIVLITLQSVGCERCHTAQASHLIIDCNERGEIFQAISSCRNCLNQVEANSLIGIVSPEYPIKNMSDAEFEEHWRHIQEANQISSALVADETSEVAADGATIDHAVEELETPDLMPEALPEQATEAGQMDESLLVTSEAFAVAVPLIEVVDDTAVCEDPLDVNGPAAYTYEQLLAKVTSALMADHSGRFYHLVMHMSEQVLNQRVTYDDDYEEFQVQAWDSLEDVPVEDTVSV